MVDDLKFALVLKFLSCRLSINILRGTIIKSWRFLAMPMVRFGCLLASGNRRWGTIYSHTMDFPPLTTIVNVLVGLSTDFGHSIWQVYGD